ncbi:GTPase domain-containing protein [Methylomagnum sp.]
MRFRKHREPTAPDPAPRPRPRNAIVYNSASSEARGAATFTTMLSFLRLLKQRHESVLRHLPAGDEARRQILRKNLQSLVFAEAFLEKGELNQTHKHHPSQIAVLGPTQAGKSSVINWLLDRTLAEVSPLAGFTVHPQGFAVEVDAADLAWLDGYFRQYQRCRRAELPADRYDAFALEGTTAPERRSPLHGAVLWDTPDFDSVDAEDYRQAVLRVAALADVAVLVLSKDKYADLSVWELLKLLAPLGQPTLICLNKIDPLSFSALAESLRDKWRTTRPDAPPPIVPIPYLDAGAGLAALKAERAQLLAGLEQARRAIHRDRHADHARRLIAAHWQDWVAPAKVEHKLREDWRQLVDDAVRDSLALYRRDYLDHPHHYETFQRALAELLTLLEIPGVGGALLAARRVVTWPLRQIVKLGQSVARRGQPPEGAEAAMLRQASEHLFIRIGENLLLRRDDDPAEQAWWRELGGLFREDKSVLTQRFDKATVDYLRAFQPEIDRTARRLYDHLRDHPAVLNGLRATRATTDAAALAVALHTGGIGVQDFIIAPAMLSLTTMLAESALGRYMDKAAAELKQRQAAAVEKLFNDSLRMALLRLPGRLDTAQRLDIPPEMLAAAEARLAR